MIDVQSSKKNKDSYVSFLTVQGAKNFGEVKRKPIGKTSLQIGKNNYAYHKFIKFLKVKKIYI